MSSIMIHTPTGPIASVDRRLFINILWYAERAIQRELPPDSAGEHGALKLEMLSDIEKMRKTLADSPADLVDWSK